MKILLYTISDFKPFALECIELLLKSIIQDIDYDFIILSNSLPKIFTNFNVIIDDTKTSNYIGYLKYSPKIPKNYDYYIYLDSDILYFDKISKLLPINKNFTIVKENSRILKNDWYYFHYIDTQDDYVLQQSEAMNAGSFAFYKDKCSYISEIYELYKKFTHINNTCHSNAKLEQSIYNYVINKMNNFDLSHCHDITDQTILFAANKKPEDNKKLYHFCGFTNEMESKYRKMKIFYDRYLNKK
jgi:hypothetical protein